MGKGINEFLTNAYNPASDPRLIIEDWNDFTKVNDFDTSNDWTVTEVGVGTQAINDTVGGELLLTTATADNDSVNIQKTKEVFKFISGRKLKFSVRFKVGDATQCDLLLGLVITDTTAISNSDGVYFRKDDGDTDIDIVSNKGNSSTVKTAIGTLVDDVYIELAFEYDGGNGIKASIDGTIVGSIALTNLPDDEDLTVTFVSKNGEAAAKTLTIDNYYVGLDRS